MLAASTGTQYRRDEPGPCARSDENVHRTTTGSTLVWTATASGTAMLFRVVALSLLWCCAVGSAHAAQIRLLCAGALTGAMETLIPEFEDATGHKVVVVFDII